jgi:glycosyltransferase involved in cell wall biosynthesis
MSDKPFVIVAHGMRPDRVRLQPWRYIHEISLALAGDGEREVIVITDGSVESSEEEWNENVRYIRTPHLSAWSQKFLLTLIQGLNPQQIWWSITPRSISYAWLINRLPGTKIALVTCPLYKTTQILSALFQGVPYIDLAALLKQSLIPKLFFAAFLRTNLFERIVVQSEANLSVLSHAGVQKSKLYLLRVGVDRDLLSPVQPSISSPQNLATNSVKLSPIYILYFGSPKKIRGFSALLHAFASAVEQRLDARLVILARGSSDAEVRMINAEISRLGIAPFVDVVGGWLDRNQVWHYINQCDLVALPFLIVPSDVPIAVLEAMARGKPVIGTDIDGLPELIKGRGWIVNPLDSVQFSRLLLTLSNDRSQVKQLGLAARGFMESYPTWDEISTLTCNVANSL